LLLAATASASTATTAIASASTTRGQPKQQEQSQQGSEHQYFPEMLCIYLALSKSHEHQSRKGEESVDERSSQL
jgi:hypothetical protein